MKTLQNFINESNINSIHENAQYWNRINRTHENMFQYIREYSPAIYNALLYMSDICLVAARYKRKNDENIDWKKAINRYTDNDVLLDKDAIRALTDGESKCKPEYKLMVRCAEAELENEDGYKTQLEKALKSIN